MNNSNYSKPAQFGNDRNEEVNLDVYDDNGSLITNDEIEVIKKELKKVMRLAPSFEFISKEYLDEFISAHKNEMNEDSIEKYLKNDSNWLFSVTITSGFFEKHTIVYTALDFKSNNRVDVSYNVVDANKQQIKSKAIDESVQIILQVLMYNTALEELVEMEKTKRAN